MILVLSGTKDGREIIQNLLDNGYDVLATTATEYGGALINSHPNLKVISKKLDFDSMVKVITDEKIQYIIDATHPYAKMVSENALKATKKTGANYARYERESVNSKDVWEVDSYEGAAEILKGTKGNILLTIGSNNLEYFVNVIDKNRLYLRVLPTLAVIKKCKYLGFLPKQIIAVQGPFSKEFNSAIYKQYDIKHMVTKDSGNVGGTNEKIQAALDMKINIVLVKRPKVNYENVFKSKEKLIKSINKHFQISNSIVE